MEIDDFSIRIKKYDRSKNLVIVNLVICNEFVVRGYTVRYTPTKYSSSPVWLVTPPCVKSRYKQYFWIAELKNTALWEILQKKIIDAVIEHTNLL